MAFVSPFLHFQAPHCHQVLLSLSSIFNSFHRDECGATLISGHWVFITFKLNGVTNVPEATKEQCSLENGSVVMVVQRFSVWDLPNCTLAYSLCLWLCLLLLGLHLGYHHIDSQFRRLPLPLATNVLRSNWRTEKLHIAYSLSMAFGRG